MYLFLHAIDKRYLERTILMDKKVAVITGASRGIGKAIALKYASLGYQIAICCHRRSEQLEKVRQDVLSHGVSCLTFVGDIGQFENASAFFAEIDKTYGQIDILVNNAGISLFGLLQDITPEQWNHIVNTNLNSAFYCSKLAIPMMLKRKQGKILSISSVWGCVGASTEVAYSTTKGGINAFTKALAKELAPSNIQVNAIACGMIDTEMNACFTEEDILNITEEIPAGRMGTCEEVAHLAASLTQKNDYLTGQIIILDGGWI